MITINIHLILKQIGRFLFHTLIVFGINLLYFLIVYYNVFKLDKFIIVSKTKDSVTAIKNMMIIVYLIPILLSYMYYAIFIYRKENLFFKISFFILVLVLSQQPYSYWIKSVLGK
ncbi:magnesium-transporting ATPase (P-type) [Chryseobacterium sediminis]|uniref:Magnesium-transporting ATPase (P-type) n=1 Tax=Chryseobacterium sediminis TaxID=1679494 RepID=A0ABR6PYL5_9FLAO|nr:magnesium-transporting ATPase (P-type) [Chryseobacterium sediminis]